MRLRSLGAIGVLAVLATLLLTVSASSAATSSERKSYIVVMAGEPLIAYDGDVAGIPATKPDPGEEVDVTTPQAREYTQYLRSQHNESLADAGASAAEKLNDYSVALNGYSALLTEAQADAIRAQKNVARVMEDELQHPTTDSSGAFLGLTQAGGAYASGLNGSGVTVGVIDTGIWPEHPSFSGAGFAPPPAGSVNLPIPCQFGNTAHNPNDAPFTCNNKLLGARQMLATYRALIGAEDFEFDSARDDNGHGTHTSSTAAGNANVPAQTFGIPRGNITGIAPRAHLIMYKGLGVQGGFTSDLVAAINRAVADGVDVINYSIGGGPSLTGGDDIAFLFAANAGVYVATSAGNSGNGAGTIGGPASVPWVTTAGANTQRRSFQGTVVLGNGARYTGVSMTDSLGKAGFFGIGGQSFALADAASNATGPTPDLCISGTLMPTVKDKIVLCRRGVNARVDKSLAVMIAGGRGMILYENDDAGDLMSDPHFVPTVHVDNTPGLAIKAYINTARGPNARLENKQLGTAPYAPSMTFFSSRGPDPVAEDIIKPDITAPGIQILAGNSPFPGPDAVPGELFQAIAGTSMSSPHIAGLFALMKQANPTWSAARTKSALMTTASQNVVDNDRVTPATPFGAGAGQANVGKPGDAGSAFQPGLTYDTSITGGTAGGPGGYIAFLCGVDPGLANALVGSSGAFCDGVAADLRDKAYNLNQPAIGISQLAGSETVRRRVTNVIGSTVTFNSSVVAPPGYNAVVSPSSLTLAPGASANFTVAFTNVSGPVGQWRFGSLTWTSGAYAVRSPIAVKGAKFNAPAEITGTGQTGAASFQVKFGYTGAYSAVPSGLTPATLTNATVKQDPDQTFAPTDVGNGATLHTFNLSDTAVLRVAIPPEATEADADLDVYVYNPSNQLVATSTLGGTDEEVTIQSPANGAWKVYVHGWQTIGPDSAYTLYSWAVPNATGGSLQVTSAPPSATLATIGTVTLAWNQPGATWNLGAVTHREGATTLGRTLVEVDNRP
jgi:subtilisin family serine protease